MIDHFNHNLKITIRDGRRKDFDRVLSINKISTPGVSFLSKTEFSFLYRICEYFRVIVVDELVVGYMFAMSQYAEYDGEEFLWFSREISDKFYYIDQVAVVSEFRGAGLAEKLYNDLRTHAVRNHIKCLVCEINIKPRNEASLRFHKKMGFIEVSEMETRGFLTSLQKMIL